MDAGYTLPEIQVRDLEDDPSAGALVTRSLARSVARLFTNLSESDPKSIHQARVATRRLRSDLRTFSPLLKGGASTLRRDLKPLAALLGEVRDRDVFMSRVSGNVAVLDETDKPVVEALLGAFGRRREKSLVRLHVYLETFDELAVRLTAWACSPPLKAGSDRRGRKVLPPLVRRRWKRVESAVREPGPKDSAALHRIRVLTKSVRYGAELVAPAVGRKADRFAAAAAVVQDVLGDHHDAVVGHRILISTARRLAPRHAAALGQLAGLELARQRQAEADWEPAFAALNRKELRKWM
ncbi:MAG: CHAD domain-containing protein [Gammaproteobacteria bacterium]|nr:CHAD domain-containing protein [Gammaproteobacteria bacterium]